MGWTGNRQKFAFAAAVLALHGLLIAILIRPVALTAPVQPEHETVLVLAALPPPKPAKPSARRVVAPPAIATTLAHPFAPAPESPSNALPGLGLSLGCGASNYDTLTDAQRTACGHGPWHYDSQAHETASLMIPPGPHQMTAAEIAEHTRNTTDPCGAEKIAHMPFCIYRIIYGDRLP